MATSREVTICELVTSDGFRTAVLLPPEESLSQGQILLLETENDLMLERVENCCQGRLCLMLVQFKRPLVFPQGKFTWAIQQGIRIRGGDFHLVRTAPFLTESRQEAARVFDQEAKVFKDDPLYDNEPLVKPVHEDVELAKWKAVKDIHRHTISPLEQADQDGVSEAERAGLLEKAAREFAVDVYARTQLVLYPIDRLTPKQRKSLARRCMIKDKANREIARNCLQKGYDQIYPGELAQQIFKATGVKLTPANAKKKRLRLGLVVAYPEGRPNPSRRQRK
jgi:hypothetical protein